MAAPDDKFTRDMEAIAHVTVPRAFLKRWLAEQERRAAGRPIPGWQYPLPHERRAAARRTAKAAAPAKRTSHGKP